MRQEMENLGLPALNYETAQRTSVTRYNHFEERLGPHSAYTTTSKSEIINTVFLRIVSTRIRPLRCDCKRGLK